MNDTNSHNEGALDPERPWITREEDLPSNMNWFQSLLNPMGEASRVHFTRTWTALFFAQFIMWFGVSTMILGISSLIGADVSSARVAMTYILAATFILTTLMSFVIHTRRLNHAGKTTAWAALVLIPLVLALLQFVFTLNANTSNYNAAYEARAEYLADPVGWRESQLEKRREAQAKENKSEGDQSESEIPEDETVKQCLARKQDQEAAVESAGREGEETDGAEADGETPETGGEQRGNRGNRGGRGGGGGNDPTANADKPQTSLEEAVLRPAVAAIPMTIIMVSIPIAIWSLLWVARAPLPSLTYQRFGLGGLLLRFTGRIGRQQFWAGVVVNLLLAGLLIGVVMILSALVPAVAGLQGLAIPLVVILFLWMQTALTSKRVHDLGESARRMALPWLISLGLIVVVGLVALLQMEAIQGQMAGCAAASPMATNIAGGAAAFAIFALQFGFFLWVGLAGPNMEDETYGAPPLKEADAVSY